MKIYLNGRLIVIETNLKWAVPYWEKRRRINPKLTWTIEDH